MFNVDGCAHADLAFVQKGEQSICRRPFHQPDHVGRGINWRQLVMMMVERVLVLHGFFRLPANAQWDLFCHAENLPKSPKARKRKCQAAETWPDEAKTSKLVL